MDAAESPLDVLSRAATMVQRNILPPSYEESRGCREEANTGSGGGGGGTTGGGGKWRRTKQSRKSATQYTNGNTSLPNKPRLPGDPSAPIDLSVRKSRGSPPSYLEATQGRQIVTPNSTPSRTTIITLTTPPTSNEVGGVCDPMIDEHFRRSLGLDYLSSDSDSHSTTTEPTSLSVDDHFAKSLGDTWYTLQKEEAEKNTVRTKDNPGAKLNATKDGNKDIVSSTNGSSSPTTDRSPGSLQRHTSPSTQIITV